MNLINKSSSPQYCGMARTTVKPGRSSTTLDVVQKFVDKLFSDSRGFQIHLSEGDLKALSKLVEAHLRSENSEKTASVLEIHKEESYSERLDRLLRNEAYRKQKRFEDAVHEARERQARIKAESNIIGPDGNPINDKIVEDAVRKDIKPELHPEMTNDIDKILANNRAVMENEKAEEEKPKKPRSILSLGLDDMRKPHEPGKNSIVAKPDGTPVPTDPLFYQSMAKTVPSGVPELPGAAQQYRDASKWRPAPGMPTA